MSSRNLFIIKSKEKNTALKIYASLEKYMKSNEFSVVFEPKGYLDEILNYLKCDRNYFALTNAENSIECGNLFSTIDSFQFATTFPKKQFADKEYEFLYNKLLFLNDIVKIVFKDPNVETLEVYISDQYSTVIDDFNNFIKIIDGKLTEALIETYKPIRGYNFFGMKSARFLIER